MDDYVCTSHNRRKCPDTVCRARAVRAGYVAPTTRKKAAPAVVAAAPEPELLWVAAPVVRYSRDGEVRESFAHYAGVPCGRNEAPLDESGLPVGWGRIVDPTARRRLGNGEHLKTTDGAELVAVGMCSACAALKR